MANNFKNPWDVGGEYYNQNALHTEYLPEGFLETKQSYQEWKAERDLDEPRHPFQPLLFGNTCLF